MLEQDQPDLMLSMDDSDRITDSPLDDSSRTWMTTNQTESQETTAVELENDNSVDNTKEVISKQVSYRKRRWIECEIQAFDDVFIQNLLAKTMPSG